MEARGEYTYLLWLAPFYFNQQCALKFLDDAVECRNFWWMSALLYPRRAVHSPLTHLSHVIDRKDGVKHFALFLVLVTFCAFNETKHQKVEGGDLPRVASKPCPNII